MIKYFLSLFIVSVVLVSSLCGCGSKKTHSYETTAKTFPSKPKIGLHHLEKLWVIGDFDGDGQSDTLFQHSVSHITKKEIDSAADPFQNDWDTVIDWFYQQQAEVYLSLKNNDNLHLGAAQGLYCLINIGDNNGDGKDEVALVTDRLDYSNVNSCEIFSLCKSKWTSLFRFGIHEDAFNFTTDKAPVFNCIKEYLEIKNGKWYYKDYSQNEYDSKEEVGKMKRLKIDACD